MDNSDIGRRLKTIRIRKGMTLKDLSSKSKLSKGFLSQVERGISNPSVLSIQRIAKALNTSLGDLFGSVDENHHKIIRRSERPNIEFGILGKKSLLTPTAAEHLEVIVGTFEVGGTTGDDPYSHGDSEELLFIIKGDFKLIIGDRTFDLAKGDSINYRSSTAHKLINVGNKAGEVMWVISPPSMYFNYDKDKKK